MRLEDIASLYGEGWDIKVDEKRTPKARIECFEKLKGMCTYSNFTINIFMKNHAHEEDYKETIVHEFLHARYPEYNEGEIIGLSKRIMKLNPEYIDVIMDVFDIPNYME